jgi:integrase
MKRPRRARPRRFRAWPRHPLTGRQFTVSAGSERELAALLHHLDTLREGRRLGTISDEDVADKLRRVRRAPRVTFERAARAYIERPSLAPNTRRRVESFLATHGAELAPLSLESLTAPRMTAWIEGLERTELESSTIGTHWRLVRAIIRYALERGWIERSPWGSWRPTLRGASGRPPREAARHTGELLELLEAAATLDRRAHRGGRFACSEAKIGAAALLGLRQGELRGLRWPDVDEGALAVRIARQDEGRPTKGAQLTRQGARRRLDVVRAVPQLFFLLVQHRGYLASLDLYDDRGPVFPCAWRSSPGEVRPYLEGARVLHERELRAAVRLAGLPNPERWTPHSLRDSFVTLEAAAEGGKDFAGLKERTRHASDAGLLRYLRARTREPPPPRMLLEAPQVPALPPKQE